MSRYDVGNGPYPIPQALRHADIALDRGERVREKRIYIRGVVAGMGIALAIGAGVAVLLGVPG